MTPEVLGYFGEGYWARVKCAERRGTSPHDIRHIKAKLGSNVQIEFPVEPLSGSELHSTEGESHLVQPPVNASRIFEEN